MHEMSLQAPAGKRNAVIMGRCTWESIPEKFRPMKGRLNVVLSSAASLKSLPDGVLHRATLQEAVEAVQALDDVHDIWVMGGARVYAEALAHPQLSSVLLTRVRAEFECDTHFPRLDSEKFRLDSEWPASATVHSEPHPGGGDDVHFQMLRFVPRSRRHPEYQYLDLIREVIELGVTRPDRTGTGTLSVFGRQMRFDLRESFPLLTTKRVFWRGLAEELLWFVKGSTNAVELQQKNVHIWDGNGSREFLDQLGFTERAEGDLGPVYGFQWRHWGAPYESCTSDYAGKGIDQLSECIDKIKNRPWDRRIVMSAWNVGALREMALPPCHMFCQFYVDTDARTLSCSMYQRSCDLGLGVPFNIASYALLTCMVAHVCDLTPGTFVHNLGDAHVYANHIEPLLEQLAREPRAFPTLRIKRKVESIDDFRFDDFEIVGYKPHKSVKMKMAV